ncbi:uncharacterized protein LOC135488635 [Lineus longissimus]|uniref:uncharacterized protein LOC135488635 n=1 Tax=Lineus longissimus TaxID=88925 RepID=UPI00315CF61D
MDTQCPNDSNPKQLCSARNISGIDLLFQGLNLSVKRKKILHDVFGAVGEGDMLAIMGPSGSGKTSLMNCIAGRVLPDSGEILANGVKFNKSMRRQMCYVEQEDLFFPTITLMETLTYSALLRLPDKMPWKRKKARIEEVIQALDLTKCQHTIIGDATMKGLSGGERKRANIGCELLTNPALMLLDEPTSGLDSSTAHMLMKTIKRYTRDHNKTVIIAIHQPSSQIFYMFDKLLLLCDGKVAYFGKTSKIVDFFDNIGLRCAPHFNPADFIMDKVKSEDSIKDMITSAGRAISQTSFWLEELQALGHRCQERLAVAISSKQTVAKRDTRMDPGIGVVNEGFSLENTLNGEPEGHFNGDVVGKVYANNIQKGSVFLNSVRVEFPISDTDVYYDGRRKYQSSFWTQFGVLFVRNMKESRHRVLTVLNATQALLISFVTGLLFFQLDRTEETLIDWENVVFIVCIHWSFIGMSDGIGGYHKEHTLILRERGCGSYRLSAYFLSDWLSQFLLISIMPMASLIVVYATVGMKGVGGFFGFYGILCLGVNVAQNFGLMSIVATGEVLSGDTVSKVAMFATLLSSGYFARNIPHWLEWMKYISFIKYALDGVMQIEFTNSRAIRCVNNASSVISSCREDNVTSVPSEAYFGTRLDLFPLWANVLCLVTFSLVFRSVIYLLLRFVRCPKSH